jgi:hypothetical protein
MALSTFHAIDDLEHLTQSVECLSDLQLVTRVNHKGQLAEAVCLRLALQQYFFELLNGMSLRDAFNG